MVTIDELRREAEAMLENAAEGGALTELESALIEMAVHASPATLDFDRAEEAARAALAAGASPAQLHETLVLVSGLGVHTLMAGSPRIGALAREAGDPPMLGGLDQTQEALWEKHVGNDRYWQGFERAVPGFLEALLRQSPAAFAAFFAYCRLPWETGAVPARLKELISLAVDASPTHRYGPGFRLHLSNAIKLGVGRRSVLGALDIAAASGPHRGVS